MRKLLPALRFATIRKCLQTKSRFPFLLNHKSIYRHQVVFMIRLLSPAKVDIWFFFVNWFTVAQLSQRKFSMIVLVVCGCHTKGQHKYQGRISQVYCRRQRGLMRLSQCANCIMVMQIQAEIKARICLLRYWSYASIP